MTDVYRFQQGNLTLTPLYEFRNRQVSLQDPGGVNIVFPKYIVDGSVREPEGIQFHIYLILENRTFARNNYTNVLMVKHETQLDLLRDPMACIIHHVENVTVLSNW
jgi:hypothetical protein